MSDQPKYKTVLGADCKVRGELMIENDLVLMGSIDGQLQVAGMLELSRSGRAAGTVVAGILKLAGRADADVVATEAIDLLPGSTLTGRLYAKRLNVAEGATIEGELHIGPKAMEKAQQALGISLVAVEPAPTSPPAEAAPAVPEPVADEASPPTENVAPAVKPTVATIPDTVRLALERGHPPRVIKATT